MTNLQAQTIGDRPQAACPWRWMPIGFRMRLCRRMLVRHRFLAAADGQETYAARRELERIGRLMVRLFGASPGTWQAISQYQQGVAVGFYALQGRTQPSLEQPVLGSPWTWHQLRQLRAMGLRHGEALRLVREGKR